MISAVAMHGCRLGRKIVGLGFCLILSAWTVLATSNLKAEPSSIVSANQLHMGTMVRIVADCDDKSLFADASAAAFQRIAEIEQICSDYRPDSEILQLSAQSPTSRPVMVSDDLWRVLRRSQEVNEASGGAFDPTIGPLTKEWRRFRRRKQLDKTRIQNSMTAVGMQHVVLHPESKSVSLNVPDMRIDLGGIAKGYAIDAALAVMRSKGVHRALVDAGGDLAIGDAPRGELGWRVGIAGLDPQQPPLLISMISNAAVATSGDAYQFLEIEGERYSHILDPRTGYGVTHRGTVTVFADNATEADAWASAFSVLGPDEGPDTVRKQSGLAVWLEFVQEGQSVTWVSPKLGAWLAEHSDGTRPDSE